MRFRAPAHWRVILSQAPESAGSGGVPAGAAEALARDFERLPLRLVPGRTCLPHQRRARGDVVRLTVEHAAQLVGCEPHWPAFHLQALFFVNFRIHHLPPYAARADELEAPFSTGAPTRLPHSVHEPS